MNNIINERYFENGTRMANENSQKTGKQKAE